MPDRFTVESFKLRAVNLREVEPDDLHALSMAVRWPYRADEWRFLLQCGLGLGALDEIDRVVATAMAFPYAPNLATLGMVIVSPRLQTQGVASWLVTQLFENLRGKILRAYATPSSRRLFSTLGFAARERKVHLFRGRVRACATAPLPRGERLEPLGLENLKAVAEADLRAFGAERTDVLRRLLARGKGYGLFEGKMLKAFAIRREVGRGHVIGPVVAQGDEDAIAIVNRHFEDLEGQLVRLDTPLEEGLLVTHLTQAGLVVFETLAVMERGEPAGALLQASGDDGPQTFALVSPALG